MPNYIDRGHGTSEFNDEMVATVCCVVERVNKLVYVRTLIELGSHTVPSSDYMKLQRIIYGPL